MKIALPVITSLCCLFLGGEIYAQEQMKWRHCVQETFQKNPELHAAGFRQLESDAAKAIAYTLFLPSASAEARPVESSGRSLNELQDYKVTLEVRINLLNSLEKFANVQRKGAEVELNRALYLGTKSNVSFSLRSAYAQVLFAQEMTALSQRILERRQQNFDLTKHRYESGFENKGSYLLTKASLDAAKLQVNDSIRMLRVSKRQLLTVMGHSDLPRGFAKFYLIGDLHTHSPGKRPNFTSLARSTPSLLGALAQKRAAEAGITLAYGRFFPQVDLVGQAVNERGTNEFGAGFAITMPLFEGGGRFFDVKRARAELNRFDQRLRGTADSSALTLERAYSDYVSVYERLAVEASALEAAQLRAEIAQSQYKNGLISFFDWNEIEDALINQERRALSIRRDGMVIEAAWMRAQGKGYLP